MVIRRTGFGAERGNDDGHGYGRTIGGGGHLSGLALGMLFLGAFVIGSAELVVVSVLNVATWDMDVSIGAAGTLVTAQ